MFHKPQNLLLLLSIIGCIYVLRDYNTSPTQLLKSQAIRLLQELRPSETLCKGVDIQSDVSTSDRDRAAKVRSALDNIRDGNPFVDFIQSDYPPADIGDEYVVPVLKYAVPWIVFFGISIISCIVYTSIWCCRRQSKSNRFKTCCFIFSMVFSAFVIGAAIAGLVLSRGIPTGSHRTICRASLLLEELAYGNGTTNWIGVKPAADRVTFILDTFNQTVDSIDAISDDFTEMRARIQPALAAVQSMYDDNAAQTATRPDPDVGGTYAPLYIQNLGPVSNQSTATGLLQLEMTTKQTVVEQAADAVNTGIQALRDNRAQYQQDLDTGREFAQLTSDSVDDVLAKVQEFGSDAGRVVDAINGALIGVLVAKLATAAFAMFMILVVCCGVRFFNKCVHMSWCALGLIGILTWAMSSLLFPLSLIMFEGCEVADKVISDPQFFDMTFNKFVTNETPNTERARQVIKQCLFEDGELLAVFGLQGKVNMFDPIFDALDSTGSLTDSVQAVPDSIAIPFNQQTIQAFRAGTTPDSQSTVEDLLKLNGFITGSKQQCTQLQDTWTLISAQCPAGSGTVFASSNAAGFNFGSATCIGFDAWGTKNIDNRYTTTSLPAGTCGDADVYLSDFVGRFSQSRQQVNTIFDNLQTSLDDVATANTAFMQSVKAVTARFDPIRQNTLTMYNALADQQTGLLHNTNCAFIQDSVQSIHDSLCVEAISSLFQATIDIIVLSFMGLFATFFVFCLSRKFSFEKKEDRQVPSSYQTKAPKV